MLTILNEKYCNTDYQKTNRNIFLAKLPKWFGERPGKKAGDPETPEGEEDAKVEEVEEEEAEEEEVEEPKAAEPEPEEEEVKI